MRITCIGHSGFAVESEHATLIFDYYTDETHVAHDIMKRAQKLYVLVSHGHQDHLNREAIFQFDHDYKIERFIMSNGCRHKVRHSLKSHPLPHATFIHHDEVWHDDTLHVHAFDSTDAGVCYLVEVDGHKIFHAGDFNDWHYQDSRTVQEVRKADGDFRVILKRIATVTTQVDLAMFPVDPALGSDFGRGAREFVTAIDTGTFIPMHMWGRDEEACHFELYNNPHRGRYVHLPPGKQLTI
mgnify:CR=1 FL=1